MTQPPVHVCFVIQKLLGLSGGAERVLLQTAAAMAARGMTVELLIFDNGTEVPRYDTAGVKVTNVFPAFLHSLRSKNSGYNRSLQGLKKIRHGGIIGHAKWAVTHGLFAQRLTSALRKRQPDVIVGFLPPAITAAVCAGRKLGIPVIASTHNVPQEDFGDSLRWDLNPVYRERARSAVQQAASITILQDEFREWFPAAIQDRIHVLANPVQRLSPRLSPAPPRDKLILAIGRLTDIKRFDLLIAAWGKIHARFPDWRIEIYGEGPQQPALATQISKLGLDQSLQLCGVTDALGPVYDRARLLCHPAVFEGFGLVVAESMAHGTPALAFSDCAGVNNLITHAVDGLLIAPQNDRVADLAIALSQALEQPADLAKLGAAAQAITTIYSAKKIAGQWDTLIRTTAAIS